MPCIICGHDIAPVQIIDGFNNNREYFLDHGCFQIYLQMRGNNPDVSEKHRVKCWLQCARFAYLDLEREYKKTRRAPVQPEDPKKK